jgi:hypothetical protein
MTASEVRVLASGIGTSVGTFRCRERLPRAVRRDHPVRGSG